VTGVGVLLAAFALLGAPLFAVIAASALAGFASSGIDLAAVPIEFYRIADTPVLSALPLFTLAGYLLGETNAPQRLVRLSEAFLGWLPGGLAIVTVASCALFTAFTGASGITIVALGALLYPAMRYAGYEERFSLGLLTTSGSLGVLFAPSLPIILYGVISQRLGVGRPVSIEELFVAGLLPGLLMGVMLAGWSAWRNRARRTRSDTFSWSAARAALRESAWELPLPFLVLGGIYSGWLAVSEVAAVTVVYVLTVEVLVLREIPLRRLPGIMRRSMVLFGAVLVILGMALASTNYLVDAEVPAKLFAAVRSHITSPFMFLLVLNGFLLVLGMILDIFSAIVIAVPLLLPMAVGYGVDPAHLAIIFLANMQIGYFTPPVGMNLFIASHRFGKPVLELCRAALPFFFILLAAVLIITYWPALSLGLIR
jgi:tripartite ATP-independent transporter DctM subunit